MEEENEGDKSNIDFETSQLLINTDEFQIAGEDSVVIKRPMSSKKSKSLENVNKVGYRKNTSISNKAIIDLYKKQQLDSIENTRNYIQ